MKTNKLFLVGTHHGSFKAGEPAEIIGVEMVSLSNNYEPRPCFKVRYKDGKEDFTPIFCTPSSTEKNPHYELITENDINEDRIPEVIH